MRKKWLILGVAGGLIVLSLALLLDDPADSPTLPRSGGTVIATLHLPGARTSQFTRSTFDDGWVSTVQPKWVEVTKGDVKVLLHYPVDVKAANTDPDVMATAAWNALVAPRYSDLQNYKTLGSVLNYEHPYLAQGNLIEYATGQRRFVVVFKQGDSGWIEIVSPDRAAFIATFGADAERINNDRSGSAAESLNALRKLSIYNKFAIAASDFNGKWSTNFSASTYYVNVQTGNSAGMSTYSSGQEYEFLEGQTYKWRLTAANTRSGSTSFAQAKGAGTFAVPDNWTIYFSDIEGKPRKYAAQFQATHGGRILILDGTAFVRID